MPICPHISYLKSINDCMMKLGRSTLKVILIQMNSNPQGSTIQVTLPNIKFKLSFHPCIMLNGSLITSAKHILQLQMEIWRIALNMMNKQLWITKKGSNFSIGQRCEARTPHYKRNSMLQTVIQNLRHVHSLRYDLILLGK